MWGRHISATLYEDQKLKTKTVLLMPPHNITLTPCLGDGALQEEQALLHFLMLCGNQGLEDRDCFCEKKKG